MNQSNIVFVAAARTLQGQLKGQLAQITATQLGAAVGGAPAQGAIARDAVDTVLAGQGFGWRRSEYCPPDRKRRRHSLR